MILSQETRKERQYELEAHAVANGVQAYYDTLAKEGHGAVPAGSQLIKAAMGPMIERLKEWLEATREGLASRSASLFYFIDQLDPEPLAWIVGHTIISTLHERPAVTRVASAIALKMEMSINVDAILEKNEALGRKVARQIERMARTSGSTRALFVRRGAEKLGDVKVVQWGDGERARVGALLLQMFAESTGLVTLDNIPMRGGKTQMIVRATESCTKWLEGSHERCALLQPERMPMVCRPRDWTNPFNGGFLTHGLRQPLVKTRNKGYLQTLKEFDMPWVYASVNALQGTEWAVNLGIKEVVKALWEAGSTLGDLPMRKEGLKPALPAQPWAPGSDPSPEALHAWKVDAARAYEADAKADSKRKQLVQKLNVAELMIENGNRFHYVYNLDWRGRMYPVGPSLTPQGDDVAKALLQFAEGSPLGDEGAYWLAVHGANTFGVDKVSFEERIEWVHDNEAMILECAADPFLFRRWADADSPFCFLAFCMEWRRLSYFHGAQEDFVSYLPVAFDGSCNGLQNFSAMLKDPVGGAATGLVPSERPSDIYTKVAQAAQAIIDRDASTGHEVALRWVGKMTRKLAKRNTMTVPYGVTRRGMRDQLYAELKDSDAGDRSADAEYLAACNYEAIGNVVVAARVAMDWLRDVAKAASKTGTPVRWTTPSGFLAVQDYREDVGEKLDFTVLGRRFQLLLQKTGDKLSSRRQALGISPNFVHSLDAAHLMRTVLFCAQDGMEDFAMIHDSYGCHAGHASRLRDNLREAFVAQYSQPVLENFRQEVLAQLPEEAHAEVPPVPEMGSLDLEQVKHSDYFFA